jgi:hypothetical protein
MSPQHPLCNGVGPQVAGHHIEPCRMKKGFAAGGGQTSGEPQISSGDSLGDRTGDVLRFGMSTHIGLRVLFMHWGLGAGVLADGNNGSCHR